MDKQAFVSAVRKALQGKEKHNKITIEKMGAGFGIKDKNLIKELTELAIVLEARSLAHTDKSTREKYDNIVDLYKSQVNLSHRTSQSVLLQQYSTPAPIGFLMGVYCGITKPGRYLEPSAGNGLLTIASKPEYFYVNEIDGVRLANLKTQGFMGHSQEDATKPLTLLSSPAPTKQFDAVLTNPPFGKLDVESTIDGYPIKDLDHLMAIRALETMKDNGRAAIIIGGHTTWDEYGRVKQGKNRMFFNYLNKFYNVLDVILIDGHALYSRQGTSFDTRLILIDGRKEIPGGVAPLKSDKDVVVTTFDELYNRVMTYVSLEQSAKPDSMKLKLKLKAKAVKVKLAMASNEELGMPYVPAAQICNTLNVDTPDSMGYEIHLALKKLKVIVGNVEDYVQKKLGYETHTDLCKALSAEQADAVALAIYNIEQRGQALIVGDQTGIGKGRIAAAMVRYGRQQGLRPIFITEKPNLFSDLYRDLKAIGSETLRPYIVNSRESKTHVKDEDGTVIYEALDPDAQKKIIDSGHLPEEFDYVMLTYSQISGGEVNKQGMLIGKSPKGRWIELIAKDNIIVMDEAHNASGDSNTGKVLQDIISETKGVTFLSATFAKRPDNMPIYAMKTAMSEANMSKNDLVEGIEKGGVALQEVLSAQLVQHGQMIRRERSFEGIEVNYITLDEKAAEHKAISDNITQIVRDIIAFQQNYVDKEVEQLDKLAAKTNSGSNVEKRKGTKGAGVDSTPYFSKVFQVINQMLFAIKADAVADRAIMRLKEGKKPVIAFSSTMGSFIESLTDVDGQSQTEDGTKINADFATVLQKGLDGVLRYTERDETGKSVYKMFDVSELSAQAQEEYNRIAAQIRSISSGIVISPIDLIKQKLTKAGYRVAEVTGRKLEVELREAGTDEELPENRISQKGIVSVPSNAGKLIPPKQLANVKALMQGEEGDFFIRKVNEIDALGELLKKRSLDKEYKDFVKKDASMAHTFHTDIALPSLHYFNGSSDWYIFEWNPKENLFFGYTVLNGDKQNAEFSYISSDELFGNYGFGRTVEMDFYYDPKPINQALGTLQGAVQNVPISKRTIGLIKSRKKENANDAFRRFQNNEVDILLINQSGSTGASAHALPTKSVSADQVKQRVMILLQAELDINTEVQKRGRINRTGQIYKPIYDYVFSAIPAEKRLMMMLQKKLKSLDANTTSNQKQSEALLSVDDFLNKIGDRVVTQYLIDNPEVNTMLDDPLNLTDSGADSGKSVITEDAAHRVSGRVAVLPTELQEKFYTTLLQLYKDEVEYLKQIDEYDLEVDVLDLKAVTLEKSIKIVGKGGQSAFGDNTYLEKCEVNILKKPYTLTELDNLYNQVLAGRSAIQVKDDLVEKYRAASVKAYEKLSSDIRNDYTNLIANVRNEKKYLTLSTPEERERYEVDRTKQLNEAMEEKLEKEKQKANNRYKANFDFIEFFTIGKRLAYPMDMENTSSGVSMAVCLGVHVNLNSEKPFLPSNMKLQIAIASGKKRIDIPLSKNKDINAIKGVSSSSSNLSWDEIKNLWQASIRKTVGSDRGTAYIVTGNLLQSYGSDMFNKGRLISYTTADGKTLKGRLMPDGWEPETASESSTVKVPIQKAIKVVQSLTGGKSISTDNGTIITKTYDDNFKIMVPSSRAIGGDVYLDQELNNLMDTGRFDKISNFMVASFAASRLKNVMDILQRNHNASVGLLPYQLDMILDQVHDDKGETAITEQERKEIDTQIEEQRQSTINDDKSASTESEPSVLPKNTAKILRLRLALKAKAVKVKLKLAA
jgi:hypothetical protein